MKTYLSYHRLPGGTTLLASVLLLLSPPVLGFAGPGAASAYILAALGAVIGARSIVRPTATDAWVIGAIGILYVVMPWIMGFATTALALWAHVVLGLVVMGAGFWSRWMGRRTAEAADAGATPPFHRKDDGTVGT